MILFIEQIKSEVTGFTEKEKKNYKIDAAVRLFEKLALDQKQEWEIDFNGLIKILIEKEMTDKQILKSFRKRYNALATEVRKKYGYVEKGYLQGNAMALGIGVGVAIGSAFITVNSAFIGVGIALGVAVGLAIGSKQEQDAKTQGKQF